MNAVLQNRGGVKSLLGQQHQEVYYTYVDSFFISKNGHGSKLIYH